MAASVQTGYWPRKRTKTFTGCWTCRARKVKCDEARPHCRQCRQKRLNCEGYGARLQWLPPDTALGSGKTDLGTAAPPEPAPTRSLRRNILAGKSRALHNFNRNSG